MIKKPLPLLSRRQLLGGLAATGLAPGLLGKALAKEPDFFTILTGSSGGTYFPVGGIIASLITNPPDLVAVAFSSQGSVANVEAIEAGEAMSCLAQADIAYWAYTGTGVFEGRDPMTRLRSIANLYPELLQFVVRRDAFITSVRDLRGKRFSLDREGSGTRADALLVLEAFGLNARELQDPALPPGQAVEAMRAGELDGFVLISGAPTRSIADLAKDVQIDILRLQGEEIDALVQEHQFLVPAFMQADTYKNVAALTTLSVGAQWLVSADADEEQVYRATYALWSNEGQEVLLRSHVKGKEITFDSALDGVALPLHPGARRFYEEAGVTHIDPLDES